MAFFAIETRDWAMAASLGLTDGGDAISQGRTLLAHAVAAGHLHDAPGGKAAALSIQSLAKDTPSLRIGSARASVPDENSSVGATDQTISPR